MVFGAWCNGSTADFGSVYPGSNPGAPAATIQLEGIRTSFTYPGLEVMLVFILVEEY
jgi:hypothetical protein